MTLYELTAEWQALFDEIEAGNIPEEAIADTVESVEGEIDAKIDACFKMVKTLELEAEALMDHAENVEARALAKKKSAERLRESILRCMRLTNRTKFEGVDTAFTVRKSITCDLADPAAFRAWSEAHGGAFIETETREKIKKAEIKEAINAGQTVDGFVLTEREHIIEYKKRG